MRTLKTIIAITLLELGSLGIKAQEIGPPQRNSLKNGIQISTGIKTWLNPQTMKDYGFTPVMRGEQEIKTKWGINVGGAVEVMKREREIENIHTKIYLSQMSVGVKKYSSFAKNKKITPFAEAGVGIVYGVKRIGSKRKIIDSKGYYVGAGLEMNNKIFNLNCEINYSGIANENLNNLEISTGFKFYF